MNCGFRILDCGLNTELQRDRPPCDSAASWAPLVQTKPIRGDAAGDGAWGRGAWAAYKQSQFAPGRPGRPSPRPEALTLPPVTLGKRAKQSQFAPCRAVLRRRDGMCETKPISEGVSSVKCQVLSDKPILCTSNLTLRRSRANRSKRTQFPPRQAAGAGRLCETNPICPPERPPGPWPEPIVQNEANYGEVCSVRCEVRNKANLPRVPGAGRAPGDRLCETNPIRTDGQRRPSPRPAALTMPRLRGARAPDKANSPGAM